MGRKPRSMKQVFFFTLLIKSEFVNVFYHIRLSFDSALDFFPFAFQNKYIFIEHGSHFTVILLDPKTLFVCKTEC